MFSDEPTSSGAWHSSLAVDQNTQLVLPTIGCLPGLTAIADEVSERWITARPDHEVMSRWLGRIIDRNNVGQIARFCIHRQAHCAGVVGFSSLDPVRMSWWVGPQWRGTGLAEASGRVALTWLGTTRAVTMVEATIHPDNEASMALARRLGFRDAGCFTKYEPARADHVRRQRFTLATSRGVKPTGVAAEGRAHG